MHTCMVVYEKNEKRYRIFRVHNKHRMTVLGKLTTFIAPAMPHVLIGAVCYLGHCLARKTEITEENPETRDANEFIRTQVSTLGIFASFCQSALDNECGIVAFTNTSYVLCGYLTTSVLTDFACVAFKRMCALKNSVRIQLPIKFDVEVEKKSQDKENITQYGVAITPNFSTYSQPAYELVPPTAGFTTMPSGPLGS